MVHICAVDLPGSVLCTGSTFIIRPINSVIEAVCPVVSEPAACVNSSISVLGSDAELIEKST